MKITINDIALACHVSKATVSRYLNRSGYVSADVADKIKAKIKELNYIPSETARSLSTKNSNVIGVVVPEVGNPFFAEIFKGISSIADANDLNILYCNTDNNATKELKTLAMLRKYNIAGLIITPASSCSVDESYDEKIINVINQLETPVVLLDRDIESVSWDGVFTDNTKGAYICTKLLITEGHKKIATITGDKNLKLGKERLKGFTDALLDSGSYIDPENIYEGDFTTETAYKLTREMMSKMDKPTGLFSPNNLTTIGILKALHELGYNIPEDIALVAFDDIELLTTLNINLSVVERNAENMGRRTMELLLERIHGDDGCIGNKRVIITPEIISRGSEELLS